MVNLEVKEVNFYFKEKLRICEWIGIKNKAILITYEQVFNW